MSRPLHRLAHPTCPFGARTWGDCDKAELKVFADTGWAAMQQVLLAWKIAARGDLRPWRKEKGVFPQLVLYIAGEKSAIFDKDGNPSTTDEVVALMAAIDRVIASDLPEYNLYDLTPKASG